MLKSFSLGIAAILALALAPAQAASVPTITVVPWLAPNGYGSPSFAGAEANAVQAMYQGLSAYGTPGTPTYFQAVSNVTSAQAIVTSFASWQGQVNPGVVFGPAFANEYGNRLHFALRIVGNGTQFAIADLNFSATSSDPFNGLGAGFSYGPAVSDPFDYGTGYVGVLKGTDGILGTMDDVFITSGANTQLVDELVSRGPGNSFWAYNSLSGGYCSSGCTLAQQQAAIDESAAYPGSPFTFTGTYSIDGAFGSGTFDINTPLPAALPLFATVLGGAGLFGWRRKRKTAAAIAAA